LPTANTIDITATHTFRRFRLASIVVISSSLTFSFFEGIVVVPSDDGDPSSSSTNGNTWDVAAAVVVVDVLGCCGRERSETTSPNFGPAEASDAVGVVVVDCWDDDDDSAIVLRLCC
jgi:hypothetical protein